MTSFNFWPVLVASVVAFAIGALWYSPILFGKEWMALSKISPKDIDDSSKKGMWKLYLTQLIATFVTFSVISFILSAVGGATAGVFTDTSGTSLFAGLVAGDLIVPSGDPTKPVNASFTLTGAPTDEQLEAELSAALGEVDDACQGKGPSR
jgi:hypothetical protein